MLFCLLFPEQEKIAVNCWEKVKEKEDDDGERKEGVFFNWVEKNWHAAQQTAEKDVK